MELEMYRVKFECREGGWAYSQALLEASPLQQPIDY